MRRRHGLLSALLILLGVICLCVGGVLLYASDFYPADNAAAAAMISTETVRVQETEHGLVFLPEAPVAGFIFYPGGLVDHTAYAPLMRALAEEGILCVLVDMPLRLAVLDMNAAEGIPEHYPQVTRWSIGGHSLGGAMAASCAAAHPGDFTALALLAAYSTEPLPDSLAVASLYGTADKVLNWEKYEAARANLPAGTLEIAIPGGNHAQFGSYGAQDGDGTPTISAEAQRNAAVDSLLPLLMGE